MAEPEYGQIQFDLICRLGELTKNEIQLVAYLYARRNRITGLCNPKRSQITADTGILKGNLSRAIAGAEKKCWILEQPNGEFLLFNSSQIDNLQRQKREKKEMNRQEAELSQELKKRTAPASKKTSASELNSQQKKEHKILMKFLEEKIGKYPDGAAQGAALKWMMLEGATSEQIKKGMERQIEEFQEPYRASYLSLKKDIFRWNLGQPDLEKQTKSSEIESLEKFEPLSIQIPVIPEDEMKTWKVLMNYFKDNLNKQIFDSWFNPLLCAGIDSKRKVVTIIATQINKDWILRYYQNDLSEAQTKAGLAGYEIKWQIRELSFVVGGV